MNLENIQNIEMDGIDTTDYPDFCDAFIVSADYEGRKLTDKEIDALNENSCFIYECVLKQIF